CVVLRGEGTLAFAAGADISEFEKRRSDPDAAKAFDGVLDRALLAIEDSPKPVIAMIHGICFGGGVEISLACDLRYAGGSSLFSIPAARLSIGYAVHGTNKLVATVGHAVAREILFTARRYNAQEALDIGLVNRVLPDGELEAYVRGVAATLADNAPLSIATSKAIIEASVHADPGFLEGRGADPALRRQRGPQGGPPRLHGEAAAGVQGPLRTAYRTISRAAPRTSISYSSPITGGRV
ncbi:MAG: enoyl-CoA hydratase/isomerase family protein, partial [Verrucomicrobia bacterium]|nr:enoyl-CoA hydratase/isomerase family protein [Verrucomicrobiota bacterium]